jgi:hypothetical protein
VPISLTTFTLSNILLVFGLFEFYFALLYIFYIEYVLVIRGRHNIYIIYMLYIVNNLELFVLNSDRNILETRNSTNLYHPMANLRVFKKDPEFFGIKVYNNLPSRKKLLNNKRKFQSALLNVLYIHSFYSIEEFFFHISMNES